MGANCRNGCCAKTLRDTSRPKSVACLYVGDKVKSFGNSSNVLLTFEGLPSGERIDI